VQSLICGVSLHSSSHRGASSFSDSMRAVSSVRRLEVLRFRGGCDLDGDLQPDRVPVGSGPRTRRPCSCSGQLPNRSEP
jgi:hypothetical protein